MFRSNEWENGRKVQHFKLLAHWQTLMAWFLCQGQKSCLTFSSFFSTKGNIHIHFVYFICHASNVYKRNFGNMIAKILIVKRSLRPANLWLYLSSARYSIPIGLWTYSMFSILFCKNCSVLLMVLKLNSNLVE